MSGHRTINYAKTLDDPANKKSKNTKMRLSGTKQLSNMKPLLCIFN